MSGKTVRLRTDTTIEEAAMGYWQDEAIRTILRVHAELSPETTLKDRMDAIDAAYPFGVRKYTPYKTWLYARRVYLGSFGYNPPPNAKPLPKSVTFAGLLRGPVNVRAEMGSGVEWIKNGLHLSPLERAMRRSKWGKKEA